MVPKLDGIADDDGIGGTHENFIVPVVLERGANVNPS